MSPIVELRQYTLKPGQRDVLIELFEREFIESQEAVGMDILGTFRDADNPDRFVWLRGFPDMGSRARSLGAFYGGAVWKAHREAANATMIDSDNVLLLRPAWTDSGIPYGGVRPPVGTTAAAKHSVIATICTFDRAVPDIFIQTFRAAMPSLFADATRFLGALVTEHSANTFPALPVREGENVFVWFAMDPQPDVLERMPRAVAALPIKPREILRLLPTPRSLLPATG